MVKEVKKPKSSVRKVKKEPVSTAKKVSTKAVKKGEVSSKSENTKESDKEAPISEEVQTNSDTKLKPATKAGKRSTKALKEAEEKQAKEERKAAVKVELAEGSKKPKTQNPARSRLERRSKKYREASKNIDADKQYGLTEAIELAIKSSTVKFDATVELHINLNVDPRQADQNIRGTVVLPSGTGKNIKVAVLGEPDEIEAAKKAGANIAAGDDFLQQLDKGKLDFDTLITSPKNMPKLGKYAKLLGPKGLMPNPKSGTVTTNIAKAVTDAKAGKLEYRVDSNGIVHVGVGKVSFGTPKLEDNAKALISAIKAAKPSSVKVSLIKTAYMTTTMGPSIKLSI